MTHITYFSLWVKKSHDVNPQCHYVFFSQLTFYKINEDSPRAYYRRIFFRSFETSLLQKLIRIVLDLPQIMFRYGTIFFENNDWASKRGSQWKWPGILSASQVQNSVTKNFSESQSKTRTSPWILNINSIVPKSLCSDPKSSLISSNRSHQRFL